MSKTDPKESPIRRHAADALRRARRLPVGKARNDLRQLAIGLLWLDKNGFRSNVQDRVTSVLAQRIEVGLPTEAALSEQVDGTR